MLPSPLRLTSFPSTKSFNRPDASDVTFQPSVGTVGRRRWRYGIFGPSTPFSPEVDSWEFYHRNMLLNLKIPEKELWKFLVPVNFSNDPGKKCSRHQHQLNFRTQCMIPSIKAYGSIKPTTAPGVATKQWQPLAKSRPWSPWQFVGIFVWKEWGVPAPGVGG